jgi:hypothetical protein
VILSGGAEIVSVAIAQALSTARMPFAVLALRPNSLLQGADCDSFIDLSDTRRVPLPQLRERLLGALSDLRARVGRPLVIFATEDGGLRCLHEFAEDVLKLGEFPRARLLRFGGLDKAELFEFLGRGPASVHVPTTEVVDDIVQAEGVFSRLGVNAIFKPALKPLDMDLSVMAGAKVVTQTDPGESMASVVERLRRAWHLSSRWVAQPRLIPYDIGERGAWAVRGASSLATIEFVERWKYPAQGGTGCWVETCEGNEFRPAAAVILDALDYVGLAELPFLRAPDGTGRLLELNARAWLQTGLAERSGLPVLLRSVQALSGEHESWPMPETKPHVWVNIERAVAAAVSGNAGPRLAAMAQLIGVLLKRPILAIYSDSVHGARKRWIGRVLSLVWRRLFGVQAT